MTDHVVGSVIPGERAPGAGAATLRPTERSTGDVANAPLIPHLDTQPLPAPPAFSRCVGTSDLVLHLPKGDLRGVIVGVVARQFVTTDNGARVRAEGVHFRSSFGIVAQGVYLSEQPKEIRTCHVTVSSTDMPCDPLK